VPGRLNALIGKSVEERRKGERRGAAGSARLRRQAGEAGERRKEGEGRETDEWGPGVSESKRKRKKKGNAGRCGVRDDGPPGRLGRKERRVRFSLFFFSFSNFFLKPLFF
jgi:hypothetical protein